MHLPPIGNDGTGHPSGDRVGIGRPSATIAFRLVGAVNLMLELATQESFGGSALPESRSASESAPA